MFPSFRPADTNTDGSVSILKSNKRIFLELRNFCDEILKIIDSEQRDPPGTLSMETVFLFFIA